MTKRNPDLKTPWLRGSLMHNPRPSAATYPDEWRENPVFAAELTFKGTERGRSAAYFKWEDPQGRKYPMFITDVGRLIQAAVRLEEGGKVYGEWYVVKRGQNYGVTPVVPDDETAARGHERPTETTTAPAGT